MELLVWGLNHKTVPVSVREQFAVPPERIGAALSQSSQYNPGSGHPLYVQPQ